MRKTAIIIILLLLVPTILAEDQIIINSDDWRDVYSGMLYGSLSSIPTSFLVSDKHSSLILGTIPGDTSIRAISSRTSPFMVGYESLLTNRGYEAVEDIYENANLALAEELELTNFIVVDDSYGYNAISVAPYAVISNSYVLFVDRTNIRDVDSYLTDQNVENLLIYGHVDRVVRDTLEKYNPETINKEGDRFANNIEIVKKYQQVKTAKQAILTNGEFIEKEIMSGVEPVIFIGANNVPDQVREYVQSSDIDIGILIGNELVGTATYIRRNVGLSVFVKFAQGARAPEGAISQVEALDMFYLPVYTTNIALDSMRYNSATKQLEVNIKNTEDLAVYFKGTYTLKAADGTEQTVGDIDAIFLDGNELKTVVYDIEPMVEGTIIADAYIIYGESKGSMEKVLDITMEILTVNVLDNCNIDLNSLEYDKRQRNFLIGIENLGTVDCYVDTEILDLVVDGIPSSYGADEIIQIDAGKTKKQKIKVRLTDEDIEENEIVTVRAYFGEREESLVRIKQKDFEMKLAGLDYVFYSLLLIIVILLFLIIWKRRKKKKDEDD